MKATLIINNQEIEVEISEAEYKKLQTTEKKKTGYERAAHDSEYCYVNYRGDVEYGYDEDLYIDNACYDTANYYSSETVAQNNARADQLMRQLRRFAVEHRESELDWSDETQAKYCIGYERGYRRLEVYHNYHSHNFGQIYFDTQEAVKHAIDVFHDELIWYFTEYKDSL